MSNKKYRDIKITKGGKFHAFGSTFETIDEAFNKCLEKTKASNDSWCNLIVFEKIPVKDTELEATAHIFGNLEFLKKCVTEPGQ